MHDALTGVKFLRFPGIFFCLGFLLASAAPAQTVPVALPSVADASLFENDPDNNLGGSATVAAGTTAMGRRSRALFQFDPAQEIPAGSTITSARLTLRVTQAPPGAVSSTFALHRLLRDWGEGTKAGNRGFPAGPGETTWRARFFPDELWSAPGGAAPTDYVSEGSAAQLIANVGTYAFESTPELVADVQQWLDEPETNFGWILISLSEQSSLTARRIGARESGASAPSLAVEYTAPAAGDPPLIVSQPFSRIVSLGGTVRLTVAATGAAPLQFQWTHNGTEIAGATEPVLTLDNVQPAQAGEYQALVTNTGGSAATEAVQVTVLGGTESLILTPDADTSLIEENPEQNFGASLQLRAGTNGQGMRRRALLRFDLATQLPPQAVITHATLVLHVTSAPDGGGVDSPFQLHRLVVPWGEGEGDGMAASAGEATWTARLVPDLLWSVPGGAADADFHGVPSAETFVAGAGGYVFESTAQMIEDLQLWVSQPENNFGWMLASSFEETPRSVRPFGAREDPDHTPFLVLDFTVEGPAGPPRIDRIGLEAAELSIQFEVPPHSGLELEFTETLLPLSWTALTNVQAELEPVQVTVIEPLTEVSRFYRLRVR